MHMQASQSPHPWAPSRPSFPWFPSNGTRILMKLRKHTLFSAADPPGHTVCVHTGLLTGDLQQQRGRARAFLRLQTSERVEMCPLLCHECEGENVLEMFLGFTTISHPQNELVFIHWICSFFLNLPHPSSHGHMAPPTDVSLTGK